MRSRYDFGNRYLVYSNGATDEGRLSEASLDANWRPVHGPPPDGGYRNNPLSNGRRIAVASESRAPGEDGPSLATEPSETGERPSTGTPSTGEEPAGSPELTLDGLLEVTKNVRRRQILQYLAATDAAVDIGELAEHLAAAEYECPDNGPTSTQRKRMYVVLYQVHLPKMDDMGVVEFDKNRGSVDPGPHAGQITTFLERADGDGTRWPRLYLGLATLAGALFAVPFVWPASGPVADVGLALVLGLFVLTAGRHLYWSRQLAVSDPRDADS